MKEYFWLDASAGTFRIRHAPAGWMLWLDDDCFDGPFASAQSALDELVGGHSAWPSCGDPSELGLPDELSEWDWRIASRFR